MNEIIFETMNGKNEMKSSSIRKHILTFYRMKERPVVFVVIEMVIDGIAIVHVLCVHLIGT